MVLIHVILCFDTKMPAIKKPVKDVNKKLESLLKDAMWIIHETVREIQRYFTRVR